MEILYSALGLIAITLVIGFGYKYKGIEALGVVPSRVELEKIIGVEASASGAEVLLFTTEMCSKCPQVRKNLQTKNVNFAEIDVTDRLDLASKLQIKQTPTVLVIGQNGEIKTRLSGSITQKQIVELELKELANAKN
ncbi:MAG TPA: thioredoxin family protein [Microbacteriaceae bacterium]